MTAPPEANERSGWVGPVLQAGTSADAIVAAIRELNPGVEVVDRGSYLRVQVERRCVVTRASIERGETISTPLRETNVFPSMVVQMINVGETTGALDAMLSKIADFYEEEVDTAVAGLLTLMEPVMIAFLGVTVGGIVIAMYLPIFDLISKLT